MSCIRIHPSIRLFFPIPFLVSHTRNYFLSWQISPDRPLRQPIIGNPTFNERPSEEFSWRVCENHDLVTFYKLRSSSRTTLLLAPASLPPRDRIDKDRQQTEVEKERKEGRTIVVRRPLSEPDNNMRPIPELPAEKVSRHRGDYSNYFRSLRRKKFGSRWFAIRSRELL